MNHVDDGREGMTIEPLGVSLLQKTRVLAVDKTDQDF